MSLAVALPAALAGAVAYGGSTAVQHLAASEETAGGLLTLLRNPRWWLSIGGDSVGFVLQILALATGPVVLIQPIFILSLPVALPIRRRLGGPPVTRSDYLACLVLIAGLGGFFLLAGDPGSGRPLTVSTAITIIAVSLVGGAIVWAVARRTSATVRALLLSSVAGVYWGVMAVLVNAVSARFDADGWSALVRGDGIVTVLGAAGLGLIGFALAQVAFQAGTLGASFPAMLVLDPLAAVVLGAAVLHERLGLTPLRVVGYVACLAAIVAATLRLADPHTTPRPGARSRAEVAG